MIFERIELTNLFSHKHTVIDLPEAGVVVVTGPNGAGKSAIIEAPPAAVWGKTLRGTEPWLTGAKSSSASVGLKGLAITRSKTPRGSPTLKWTREGASKKETTFGTTTKAQEALDKIVLPFDVWKRANAFSSEDRAHFSRATDKERKQLIESLIGIGGLFDGALKSCRGDLKAAREEQQACGLEIARLEERLAAEKRRKKDRAESLKGARQSLQGEVNATDDGATIVEEPLGDLEDELGEVTEQVTLLTSKAHAIDLKIIDCDNEAGNVRRRADALDADECPTCGQDIPQSLVDSETEKARTLKEIADEARADGLDEKETIVAKLRKLQESKRDLEQRVRSVSNVCSRLEVEDRNRKKWEQRVASETEHLVACEQTINRLGVELDGAQDEEDMLAEDVGVLVASEKVLGLKGVRAQVLGKALGGIEAVANAWLSRLACGEMRVCLSGCKEQKGGGISDEVSLEVEGAGGGHGYRASSGGERRRIDVALLLAMAEVAAVGHSSVGSTMFFDEVFDCLDEEGTTAVARALEDLAVDRCVVVVTHSTQLADELSAVRRLHVEGGAVDG